ncbi:hypothetical protein [Phaeocystidibacter marisrubri]|uniref:Uncharacterized protein n=1 Tax=Phaeocystidibacter marisrubri TaxID=1577780 RepID=A0A6L3ZE25_9FLAO|nr:hypothetical protein [Phaeocystidibacter marisrubri]KAB2816103.1 hypothetical protein F8C82_10455 [Phaeocystidibacter marisrubri]GGH67342.1 hypothetical protein GCM10011318_06220 [Phaeocystidibacter marisrubri]
MDNSGSSAAKDHVIFDALGMVAELKGGTLNDLDGTFDQSYVVVKSSIQTIPLILKGFNKIRRVHLAF